MGVVINRFDVFIVTLDPTIGSEIQKARPCLVISPDEMNRHIRTVIVAPMTTRDKAYPSRVDCRFGAKDGHIVLDQIRTVDKVRLVKRLGRIGKETQDQVLAALGEIFSA
jgi:mRNA interferase MazF